MPTYQVIARKYRPQSFAEIVGQEAIVQTLKNALRSERLAHAYLFCGSRGTGKTTLARVLAKALNCAHLNENFEPCNTCSSCKEITSGQSLDVLEIDGASHRGIDDIRQINDTVGYAASSGRYKIYIIDEVHMLTKEAFNALLKTLEEPPPNVKFLFATTEPHKVLPTILSRCQRFNLNRIPLEAIVNKLRAIATDLGVLAEEEALHLLAKCADGGLRDAESLLDQILVFHDGQITVDTVSSVLGIVARDILFELDAAGKEGRFAFAFEVAHLVFSQGKDLLHFIESLVEHFRNLLLVKLSGPHGDYLLLSENEREKYAQSAKLYTKEQCLNLLEYLVEEQNKVRFMPSPRIALESILLHVMRVHQRLPIEVLVRSLTELEDKIAGKQPAETAQEVAAPPKAQTPAPAPAPQPAVIAPKAQAPMPVPQAIIAPKAQPAVIEPPAAVKAPEAPVKAPPKVKKKETPALTVDPTPTPEELGIKPSPDKKTAAKISAEQQSRYDTLMHFAAVELEGTVQKG